MIDWKRKLTSRKFWVAVIGFVTPLLTVFNVSESEITQITAIIMAGATLIAYIFAEGWTDASGNESQEQVSSNSELLEDTDIADDEFEDEEDEDEPELTDEPEVDISKETGITPEQMLEA